MRKKAHRIFRVWEAFRPAGRSDRYLIFSLTWRKDVDHSYIKRFKCQFGMRSRYSYWRRLDRLINSSWNSSSRSVVSIKSWYYHSRRWIILDDSDHQHADRLLFREKIVWHSMKMRSTLCWNIMLAGATDGRHSKHPQFIWRSFLMWSALFMKRGGAIILFGEVI